MLPTKLNQIGGSAHRIRWQRSLILGLAATALTGGVAMATPNWTYIINFDHAPVINESSQTGNFQIWGLGYAKMIVGSQGSNVIVADGACQPGSSVTTYCSTAPFQGSRNTLIYGNGNGHNTIYAGYGPAVIFGGTGPNTITSSPTSSLIIGGNAGDTINADQGETVVYAGTGVNTIYALSPERDRVYCSGTQDTVYAYRFDKIHHCATVIYQPDPTGHGPAWSNGRHYDAPSLRRNAQARRLYARLKAAERRAHH